MGKLKDETGNRYGKLKILKRDPNPHTKPYWICQCDCGSEPFAVYGTNLRNGTTTQCKQCRYKQASNTRLGDLYKNLIGQSFNHLIVIEEDLSKGNKAGEARYWKCKCDCGKIISISTSAILHQKVFSCGCSHSKGEEKISKILTDNQILFEKEKTFENCRFPDSDRKAKFDFYLPKENVLIEFDGRQHYENSGGYYTEEEFQKLQKRDAYKNEWCKKNKIPLIRIPYYNENKITIDYLMEAIKNAR